MLDHNGSWQYKKKPEPVPGTVKEEKKPRNPTRIRVYLPLHGNSGRDSQVVMAVTARTANNGSVEFLDGDGQLVAHFAKERWDYFIAEEAKKQSERELLPTMDKGEST